MRYLFFLCLVLASPVFAAPVTSITVPIGVIVHVTVLQNGVAVPPGQVTWKSPGPTSIGTIDVDSSGTGWNFMGTVEGSATVTATKTDGAAGKLGVTVTPAPTGTPAPLTFTSP